MFYFLGFLWVIRTTKTILFWFYLWQLKEYHIGRFLAHFQTDKGKQLFCNQLLILKIILLSFFFVFFIFFLSPDSFGLFGVYVIKTPSSSYYVFGLILFLLGLYFIEAGQTFKNFLPKKLKKPVLTKKSILLILMGLLVEILILIKLFLYVKNIFWFAFWILTFDILMPAITSMIVLFFQPLAVLGRKKIINRAREKRLKFKNLLVIGITGSYGKTSVKEFLSTILAEKFRVLKTKEHQNSEVGISQCILRCLKPEHEIFVCEMGAYNRGGIKLLGDIAKPKIGILTGINEQHMATFGSQENIIKTKYELIESLPENGLAFFNAKNKHCLELYQKAKVEKYLYGNEASFPGEENILGAMAVARKLGMNEEDISRAYRKIKNKFGGVQLKKGIKGLNIIDATYSANPDGVIAHLEYMKTFRQIQGKRIIVMPCLIELGKSSKEVHRRIGKKIGEVCDLAIITTKERFKEIKKSALEKGIKEENIMFMENPIKIFEKIKNFCREGDLVLLESRMPNQLIKELLK